MYTDSAPGAPGTAAIPTIRYFTEPLAPGSSNCWPTLRFARCASVLGRTIAPLSPGVRNLPDCIPSVCTFR